MTREELTNELNTAIRYDGVYIYFNAESAMWLKELLMKKKHDDMSICTAFASGIVLIILTGIILWIIGMKLIMNT